MESDTNYSRRHVDVKEDAHKRKKMQIDGRGELGSFPLSSSIMYYFILSVDFRF